MKIVFTTKAQASIKQIASYLQESKLEKSFITKHLKELKAGIVNILTSFPESGSQLELNGVLCRRLVVKHYNILYRFDKPNLIRVLLVYKQNLPKM